MGKEGPATVGGLPCLSAYLPLRPFCSQNALTSSELFRSYEEIGRELSEFGVVMGSDVFDVADGVDIASECAYAPVARPTNRTNASDATLIVLIFSPFDC